MEAQQSKLTMDEIKRAAGCRTVVSLQSSSSSALQGSRPTPHSPVMTFGCIKADLGIYQKNFFYWRLNAHAKQHPREAKVTISPRLRLMNHLIGARWATRGHGSVSAAAAEMFAVWPKQGRSFWGWRPSLPCACCGEEPAHYTCIFRGFERTEAEFLIRPL